MLALVLDDSRAMRRIIRHMLEGNGFDIIEAEHGQEALQKLQGAATPDVMLVDWNMPVMDGLTFVQAIRSSPEYTHVPIIMVTTETEIERISRAIAAGANEYVMKPFDQEILLTKLQFLGLEV